MAQVNVAYAKGEQATIEKLMLEFGQDPEAITGDDLAARMIRTIRRNAQLRRRLTEAEQEITVLTADELYELRLPSLKPMPQAATHLVIWLNISCSKFLNGK